MNFPQTRYQGSKYKLLDWMKPHFEKRPIGYALDAFSGTSSVSYLLKSLGWHVQSNDIMPCNYWIAKALIENNHITLSEDVAQSLLRKSQNKEYQSFIADTFEDIYYTTEENILLDIIVQNIHDLNNEYEKAIALWALFQSCIIKRPYNLFHRKNLHIRTADVERSFGNKTTWDKPIEHFFLKFVKEANNAIFDNRRKNIISCSDVLELPIDSFDLVYIDPPYIPASGTLTKYEEFYHFLNGLTNYSSWGNLIDYSSKHKKLITKTSPWEDKQKITETFTKLIDKHISSDLVISYRYDGIPSIEFLSEYLMTKGKKVDIIRKDYQYALSEKKSEEILIIAK